MTMVFSSQTTVIFLAALCNLNASFALAWAPPSMVRQGSTQLPLSSSSAWNGEVVSNEGGAIRGCSIEPVGSSEPVLEWEITIDGVEADIGRFSEAIYKKVTADAKKERFQGFRPGTIPPHLQPTYRAFAMDECARETVLEAMQQNNIRPFDSSRGDFKLESFWIPPPPAKKSKKRRRKKKGSLEEEQPVEEAVEEPKWRFFESMKEAVDAGWKPGQSFSFVAKNVRGQKVRSNDEVQGSRPLGINY